MKRFTENVSYRRFFYDVAVIHNDNGITKFTYYAQIMGGAGLYAVHFWRYGKDSRLSARI